MRLVCPNCEAKYEVPDDAIPDTGRDVQCANCGHAWFQMRGRAATDPVPVAEPAATEPEESSSYEAEPITEVPVVEEPVAEEPAAEARVEPDEPAPAEPEVDEPVALGPEELPPATDPVTAAEAAALDDTAPTEDNTAHDSALAEESATPVAAEAASADADAATPADRMDDEVEAAPQEEPAQAAYAVDESVLAILREEAEREAAARRQEAPPPIEVQTDLGLGPGIAASASAAAAPTARVISAPGTDDKPSARRDLLPDVEEINSTLRPSEIPSDDDELPGDMPPSSANRSGGFRSGFLVVMTVAMIGAAVYMAAPALSRMAPSLAGPLEGYVGFVNGLRLELDGLMRSATVALNGE